MAALALALISVAAGAGLLWIFAKTSRQEAIRATKKRLQARLLEMRLYADDARVVLAAQRALLFENLRYFGHMLRPAAFATLPMLALFVLLDGFFGRAPLAPGRAAVVTAQFPAPFDESAPPPELGLPAGIRAETPAVRVAGERQVSWRIRPERAVSGELFVIRDGERWGKKIAAGAGWGYLARRRSNSIAGWLLEPAEAPLPGRALEWIEVEYPPAAVGVLGLEAHWLVWFLVFSMAAALALKGRFRVTI
jgi:hypothetical protein